MPEQMPDPVAAPAPDYSAIAERIGHEGMVTVWDAGGRYAGCMGSEVWRKLLLERERRDV